MVSDSIQSTITQRLRESGLDDVVTFQESAFQELSRISSGNLEIAEQYASVAVLNALYNQEQTISSNEISTADPTEAEFLAQGGQDIWETIKYILQILGQDPTTVDLKRCLSLWDAERTIANQKALANKRLPRYVLVDEIYYQPIDTKKGIYEAKVIVPLRYSPCQEEIKAVAANFAEFITGHTGEPQILEDFQSTLKGQHTNPEYYYVFIKAKPEEKSTNPDTMNYEARTTCLFKGTGEFAVSIRKMPDCKHEEGTLEAYVNSTNSQKQPSHPSSS